MQIAPIKNKKLMAKIADGKMKMMKRVNETFKIFKGINRSVFAVLVLTLTFTACEYEEWSPYKSNATLSETLISYNETTISGATFGNPELTWSLQVLEGTDFCTPVSKVGFVQQNFSLHFAQYAGAESRTAKIKIKFSDGYTNTFTVRQLSITENPDYDRAWGEQPEVKEGVSLVYKTYYTILSNRRVRNYSICYDTEKLVPLWVAYPVHRVYEDGDVGRTNEWSFDDAYYTQNASTGSYIKRYVYTLPIIPQSQQQNIESGGYGYDSGLDRGHMLPSASRQSTYELNAQTYYATNMMPQQSQFNQNIWASLEGDVRDWKCSDTLFVVTGTLYEGEQRTITARGRTIAVPSHAYKLLLRTKNGNTQKNISDITSASELKAIGFLFENNSTGASTSIKAAAVSVAEIERRTGFKFFRNLNPAIADQVKSQKNLSEWGL